MSDKTYYLRRVNKDNWAGISLYQFANEDIGAGVDDYGLPITGLTEDAYEENSKGNKQLVKGTRTLLEEAMSLEPGTNFCKQVYFISIQSARTHGRDRLSYISKGAS